MRYGGETGMDTDYTQTHGNEVTLCYLVIIPQLNELFSNSNLNMIFQTYMPNEFTLDPA